MLTAAEYRWRLLSALRQQIATLETELDRHYTLANAARIDGLRQAVELVDATPLDVGGEQCERAS